MVDILLINLAIALFVVTYFIINKQFTKGLVYCLFILIAPVIAPLCLGFSFLYNTIFYKKDAKELQIEELSMRLDGVKDVVEIDVENEIDKIPLVEAMLTSNKKSRRKVLLDVLKNDKDETTFKVIKDASKDDDSEISHYAITFITAITADYRKQEDIAAKALNDDENLQNRMLYIQCLFNILKHKFFTEYEQERYMILLDKQLEIVQKENSNMITSGMIGRAMDLWHSLGNTERVNYYLFLVRKMCDADLAAIKKCLKYYYILNDKNEFKKLLAEVRTSALDLDSEVLEWIRFYNTL